MPAHFSHFWFYQSHPLFSKKRSMAEELDLLEQFNIWCEQFVFVMTRSGYDDRFPSSGVCYRFRYWPMWTKGELFPSQSWVHHRIRLWMESNFPTPLEFFIHVSLLLFFSWKIAFQAYHFCCYFWIKWDFMTIPSSHSENDHCLT